MIPKGNGKWFIFFNVGVHLVFYLFSREIDLIMTRKGRFFCKWLQSSFHVGKSVIVFDFFYCYMLLLHQLGGLLLLSFLSFYLDKISFKLDDPCRAHFCL